MIQVLGTVLGNFWLIVFIVFVRIFRMSGFQFRGFFGPIHVLGQITETSGLGRPTRFRIFWIDSVAGLYLFLPSLLLRATYFFKTSSIIFVRPHQIFLRKGVGDCLANDNCKWITLLDHVICEQSLPMDMGLTGQYKTFSLLLTHTIVQFKCKLCRTKYSQFQTYNEETLLNLLSSSSFILRNLLSCK